MKTKIKIFLIQIFQYFLIFLPIKRNRMMFYANNRKGYVCNPAFLMRYIEQTLPSQFELIWVTRFPESCKEHKNIIVCRQRSLRYYLLFLQTKFFITNDMIDETLVKKKGQIFLTTWHGGGAYKKVGTSTTNEDALFAKNFNKWYGRLDYFVSSCRACTTLYSEAFDLPASLFLETGTPRNDLFFSKNDEIRRQVYDFYKLSSDTKIILFAPSFQLSSPEKERYDIDALCTTVDELRKRTGKNWVLLYRSHYFCEEHFTQNSDKIKDGNAYFEMQHLLYSSAVLVTDFSSCIWDFGLTGRPVILLENRLKEYEKEDRGFFIPYDKWPYLKVPDIKALTTAISENYQADFSHNYAAHYKELGSFESGTACEKITKILLEGVI